MNRAAYMIVAAALLLALGVSACTVIDGACWSRDENGQGSGAGGGPLVPGQGGFGDVAPAPQGTGESRQPSNCASTGMFSPSLFKFVTIVADTGEGVAGGWQKATATVGFADDRQDPIEAWSCPLAVGMPIRSAAQGKISATKAADMTATVLTHASGEVMHSRPTWIPALFCIKLRERMEKMFDEAYPKLGATVASQ